MRVAFQGEPGAFGEEAIVRHVGTAAVETVGVATFADVCRAVEGGQVDAGVLPLENSLAGTVGDALDALATGTLTVVGEVLLPIHHHLLIVPGTSLADVNRVTSHWQALAQCQAVLGRHGWRLVPAADTAGSARELAARREPGLAAIASERAAERYGLDVALRDIADAPHNVTRFAVIRRDTAGPRADELASGDDGMDYGSLLTFETGHRPGDLVRVLALLAEAGVNLSRIESRPSGEGPWRYRFLIQVSGDAAREPLRGALEGMRAHTRSLRVLGSFPIDQPRESRTADTAARTPSR
jgi:prephenate dehydratase